ncbi:hypothetical protein [Oceanobacter mangrovi]|uniref:hypothetical protein n=1 Tax=Oceanobacter mangrovi TaxID=2862510 RepID=UPI001C8DA903|nr:hypothetical protein [Oceanobacter mangrovi]
MKYPVNRVLAALMLAGLLSVSGCATKHIANEASLENQAAIKAGQLTGDTQSALDKAEEAINKGKSENFALLTPLHWQQMNDAIKLARKDDLEGNADKSVSASARVLALYDSATITRVRVAKLLQAALARKTELEEIKADKVLPKDFRDIRDQITDLARQIEAGKDDAINDDVEDVLADMTDLERDTMLEIHWRPAAQTLTKARKENVDDFAPQTFRQAEELTDQAEDTIREYFQDRQLCAETGLQALRAAQHALYIGREAEAIVNMKVDDAEQAALRFEGYLHQLAAALEVGDLRNMAFMDQTLALVQKAKEQTARIRQPLEKQIEALEVQINQLKAEIAASKTTSTPAALDDETAR